MNNFKQAGRYFQKHLPANIKKRVLRAIMALKDEQIKNTKTRIETVFTVHLNKIQAIWVYDICDFAQLASQDFASFRTDFYMMYLYESGQGMYSIELEDISITAKNLLFISPNTVNQFHKPFDCNGKVLIFTESVFMDEPARIHFLYELKHFNSIENEHALVLQNRYNEIACLFQMIENELQNPYNGTQKQILSNYLFNILLIRNKLLNPIQTLFDSDFELVKRFKKQVHKEENKNQTIKYYATALNVSVITLEKAFKKQELKTPKRWLINLIVLEIKQKLIYNELPTKELAAEYGFSEVTNFIKFFKKHTGFTPKQFRLSQHQNQ